MRKIFLFNLNDHKLINLLKLHNYEYDFITNEMLKLEDILNGKKDKEVILHKCSLMLFNDFDNMELDAILKLLKDNELSCDFKAVVTKHNLSWSIFQLLNELSLEKARMK